MSPRSPAILRCRRRAMNRHVSLTLANPPATSDSASAATRTGVPFLPHPTHVDRHDQCRHDESGTCVIVLLPVLSLTWRFRTRVIGWALRRVHHATRCTPRRCSKRSRSWRRSTRPLRSAPRGSRRSSRCVRVQPARPGARRESRLGLPRQRVRARHDGFLLNACARAAQSIALQRTRRRVPSRAVALYRRLVTHLAVIRHVASGRLQPSRSSAS